MYRSLSSDKILATFELLHRRIQERFLDHSLSKVAEECVALSRESINHVELVQKPYIFLRSLIVVLLSILLVAIIGIFFHLNISAKTDNLWEFTQGIEAGINDLVFLGIAIYFLSSIETRFKRDRTLKMLHQLRSVAHVIDMHQLTKDPEQLITKGKETSSSPKRNLNRFELVRYLDYCSELLSLIGKLAALYVQKFNDPIALAAVNDIETLVTGISGKIWQKIAIIDLERTHIS